MSRQLNYNLLIGILLLIFGGGLYSELQKSTGILLIIFGLLFLILSFVNKSLFKISFFKNNYKPIFVISSISVLLFFFVYDVYKSTRGFNIKNDPESKNTVTTQKTMLANRNPLFDPNKTCNLFRLKGYTFYPWKNMSKDMGGDFWWSCLSDLQYRDLDGSDNEVSLFAESTHGGDKIEYIEISTDIFDVVFKDKVKKEFINKAKEFFKKAGIIFPSTLINHINIEADYNTNVENLNISFEVDKRAERKGYGLAIKLKPLKTSINTSKVIKKQKTKENVIRKSKPLLITKNSLFDPNITCNNFIFDGYYHYQWKIILNSWSCHSISENGMSSTQNEVNFYAESNRSDKIESIEISAEIYDVSIKEKIIKEFKNKLKSFFEKSEIKLPDSLINHINIEANYNLTMSDLDISFEVDRSFPNGIYELILTIKPMK